jgi:hypothetical protein
MPGDLISLSAHSMDDCLPEAKSHMALSCAKKMWDFCPLPLGDVEHLNDVTKPLPIKDDSLVSIVIFRRAYQNFIPSKEPVEEYIVVTIEGEREK